MNGREMNQATACNLLEVIMNVVGKMQITAALVLANSVAVLLLLPAAPARATVCGGIETCVPSAECTDGRLALAYCASHIPAGCHYGGSFECLVPTGCNGGAEGQLLCTYTN